MSFIGSCLETEALSAWILLSDYVCPPWCAILEARYGSISMTERVTLPVGVEIWNGKHITPAGHADKKHREYTIARGFDGMRVRTCEYLSSTVLYRTNKDT